MLTNNSITRCLVITVVIGVLAFIPTVLTADSDYHIVMLDIPECSQESHIWCGPATAKMVMKGYPSVACDIDQDVIWGAIESYRVEGEWHTDPQGLRDAMQSLCPPIYQWVVFHKTDPQELMYSVAYWMTKNDYPVALLLSTEPHNGIPGHEEHWVEIRGIITDEDPTETGNTTIGLKFVWYTDPSPAELGDPAITELVSGSEWYTNLFKPVTKPTSSYVDQYVAIIEPPSVVGKAVAAKEVLQGEVITPSTALEHANKWIEKYKLYEIKSYKMLKRAKPLEPLLVNEEYYIIQYISGDTSISDKNVRVSLLINAFNGNFQRVGTFAATEYLSTDEAKEIAFKYLNIQRPKKVKAELVTQIERQSFNKYFPPWKITVGDKVVHIDQRGKIFTDELPGYPHGKPPKCRKWSASIHGGVTYPITDFGSRYNSSYMFGVDLDYHFTPKLSAVAFVGFNHFLAKKTFPYLSSTHWWNISANLKWEFNTNPLRPYVNGGFGLYIPKTGSTKPGYNVGVGIDRSLAANVILEVGLDYHRILTNVEDPEFYTTHVGLNFLF